MIRRKTTKNSKNRAGNEPEKPDDVQVKEYNKKTTRFSGYVVFSLVFLLRFFNAVTTRTYFQADEFFQCLEPAHKFVYGYGYVTWEWNEKLRSAIHPFLYVLGYKFASYFNDDIVTVTIIPKVLSAAIASLGETMLYKFVYVYSNDHQLAVISLILSLLNPFNWHVVTRSFSNCFELTLTLCAFRFWPWNARISANYYKSLLFAIISCLVRPTNIMLWSILGLHLLVNTPDNKLRLMAYSTVLLALTLLANLAIDFVFYKEWTFPLYNFVEFNVIKSLSIFYGVAPWHFYIFQAVPLMLMTYLPFFLHGLLRNHNNVLVAASSVVLLGFSSIAHKEFRFIYPLMPTFILVTAYSVQQAYRSHRSLWKKIALVIVFVNIGVAYFFTRVNERGAIDVIDYLRDDPDVTSFGFLTPCHSTPWQSHLHDPQYENSWFLTCEPPLHLGSDIDAIKQYKDESDIFFENPTRFLDENFPSLRGKPSSSTKYTWPSHVVVFQPLEATMNAYFENTPYHECNRFFNSYFHWDSRRSGDIIVYCSR